MNNIQYNAHEKIPIAFKLKGDNEWTRGFGAVFHDNFDEKKVEVLKGCTKLAADGYFDNRNKTLYGIFDEDGDDTFLKRNNTIDCLHVSGVNAINFRFDLMTQRIYFFKTIIVCGKAEKIRMPNPFWRFNELWNTFDNIGFYGTFIDLNITTNPPVTIRPPTTVANIFANAEARIIGLDRLLEHNDPIIELV